MQDLNALGPRLQLDLLRDWPKLALDRELWREDECLLWIYSYLPACCLLAVTMLHHVLGLPDPGFSLLAVCSGL